MLRDKPQTWKIMAIRSIFVQTADHNYIVARWAFFHSLYRDYYWNALHGVEKYLKAALVCNNVPVHKFKHDIMKLFDELLVRCEEFLPPYYSGPVAGKGGVFYEIDRVKKFVERLNFLGCTDNRYAYFSNAVTPEDIFYLDALVFSIRRLCIFLDRQFGPDDDGFYGTYRDKLKLDPAFQPHDIECMLPRIASEQRLAELKVALFQNNQAFTGSEEYPSAELPGLQFSNSILYLLTEGAESPERTDLNKVKANVIRWLVSNIAFDPDTKRELIDAAEKHDPVNA